MPSEAFNPIDIDAAVASMFVKDEPAGADPVAAADPAPAAAADPVPAASDPNPDDNAADPAAAAADPDAQGGDPADTDDEGGDPGANALPPIEAPSSWSTEEKAEWNGLSRKAQEAISRREQESHTALRTAQNRTAEQQKAVDAEVTRLKGLTGQIESHLNDKMNELARDFPDVKTEADLVALSGTDPSRYLNFKARLEAIGSIKQVQDQATARINQADQQAANENVARVKELVLKEFPTWSDPEVARREITELQDYAIKEIGVPEAAARGSFDPYTFKLARKAMAYDRAQAAAKAAVDKTPPRIVKPGTQSATPKADAKAKSRATQLERLNQSGDIMDAMKLMFE